MWEKLGPLERSVLNTYAWRLYAGQRKYGQLEEDKKVWTWEAAEELLDAAVYLGAALVAATEQTKRRYFNTLDASVSVQGPQGVEQGDVYPPERPFAVDSEDLQWPGPV